MIRTQWAGNCHGSFPQRIGTLDGTFPLFRLAAGLRSRQSHHRSLSVETMNAPHLSPTRVKKLHLFAVLFSELLPCGLFLEALYRLSFFAKFSVRFLAGHCLLRCLGSNVPHAGAFFGTL